MAEKITYCKPDGEWGIEGVDLTTLPPKVYSALCKLKDIEWPFGCDIVCVVGEDGTLRRRADPYCTLDIETEADLQYLKAAVAYYNEHGPGKEVQA